MIQVAMTMSIRQNAHCHEHVFKITGHLDDDRDFSDVLDAQAAAGEQPFYCLSNFLGCMPGIRVWTIGSSKNWRFCAQWFFEPNSTGMFETYVAWETLEWHWRNYTTCLLGDSSLQRQCLHITWIEHAGYSCLHCSQKTAKQLSRIQRTIFFRSTHQRHGLGMRRSISWIPR